MMILKTQKLLPNKLSQLGPGITWGDIDEDGDDDFLLEGFGYLAQLYLNEGNGNFRKTKQNSFNLDLNSEYGGPVFDSGYDGDLDFVVSGGVECIEADSVLVINLFE